MTETTLMDKINIIFNMSKNPKMIIILISLFVIFIGLMILAITMNKKNASKIRSIVFIIGVSFTFSIIFTYFNQVRTLFDFMINNIFINIYFPNITIYCLTIIITNIIIFTNLFSIKTPKLLKSINIIMYCIIHYLMILILNVIDVNEINIFAQNSLYGNEEAQALIETSTCIFIIWIIFLIIYLLIRKTQTNKNVKPLIIENKKEIPILEDKSELEELKEKLESTNKKLEDANNKLQNQINESNNENNYLKDIAQQETEKLKVELIEKNRQLEEYKNNININNSRYESDEIAKLNLKIKIADQKLKVAEDKIANQESKIEMQNYQNKILSADKSNLLDEKLKLTKEKERLEKLNSNLKKKPFSISKSKNSNDELLEKLDSTFTIEDYKYLLTILKEKQKKKTEHEYKMSVLNAEPVKFSQIQEAYKSTK